MRHLASLCLCALALACGPDPDEQGVDNPLEGVRDTLAEDTVLADDPASGGEAGSDPAGTPEEADPVDEPGAADPVDDPGAAGSDLPPWTTDVVSWSPPGGPAGVATARELRAARHEGYDRWVVDFAEEVPGYRVRYIDRPLHECGSGNQVYPVGEGWLELRLEPARGHTEEGRATLPRELATPALTRGLRVYRTCDFEAIVTLVVAANSPEPFRAFHLDDPPRVVVDVRH